MKAIPLILTLFFSSLLFGQKKTLINVLNATGDTSFFFKYQTIVIEDISIARLDTCNSPFYFRLWTINQVIDIWQTDETSFSGQLTSWVIEHTQKKKRSQERTFVQKNLLGIDTVRQIIDLLKSTKIYELPTDDSIKGWKGGFDGFTYIVEFASSTTYSFKTYWSPAVQDSSIIEAKLVQDFIDKIALLSDSASAWKKFEKNIPYQCYYAGGSIACKVNIKKTKENKQKTSRN